MGLCRAPSKPTVYALVAVLSLSAPAAALAGAPGDPWEPANRSFYFVHTFLDHLFFGPVARGYKAVVPFPLRKGLRNLINNLREPGIAFNDLLQAHPVRASQTAARFIINTSVGIGGLMDAAYNVGFEHHENGFGTTAGRYGIGPGPYLFIPFLGPTDVRDLIGQVADTLTDPLAWAPLRDGVVVYSRGVVDGVDQRAEADDQLTAIDNMSTDPYASLRSLYEQNRAVQVHEAVSGVPGSAEPKLDSFDDPGAAPAPAAQPRPGAALDNKMIDRMVDAMLARPLTVVPASVLNADAPAPRGSGALAQVESPAAG